MINETINDLVSREGAKALLGSAAHRAISRQFGLMPPTAWLETIADQYRLSTDSSETISALIDAWLMLKLPDAKVRSSIIPAMLAEHPSALANLTDQQLLTAWRNCFQPSLNYARKISTRVSRSQRNRVGMSVTALRNALGQAYGLAVISALEAAQKLRFVKSAQDLPADIRGKASSEADLIAGVTTSECVYLVAGQINPDQATGIFLHEVGEHAGMEQMLGADYGRLVGQFDRLLQRGDSYATWAAARVPRSTGQENINSERLAYLIEKVANDAAPLDDGEDGYELGQKCLSSLRTWIFKTPTCRWLDSVGELDGFTLNPQDIATLAREAVNFHVSTTTSTAVSPANQWDEGLSRQTLDELFAAPHDRRQQALEQMEPDNALGYIYALATLGAPEALQTISAFKSTIAEVAAKQHTMHLSGVASAILVEERRLLISEGLTAQVARSGFAIWSADAGRDLYLAAPADAAQWSISHYQKGLGHISETYYQDADEAFASVPSHGQVIPEKLAGTALQQVATTPKFSFAGHRSMTADRFALATAKELSIEGLTPESIRQHTGWFLGRDEEWRFEIDDSEAVFTLGQEDTQNQKENAGILADFLDHQKLYAAYPGLANINISITIDLDADNSGAFISSPKNTSIRVAAKDHEMALSIILHECQHYIQNQERFAQGADKASLLDIDVTEQEVSLISKELNQLLDSNPSFASLQRQKNRDFIKIQSAYGADTTRGRSLDWDNVPEEVRNEYFNLLKQLEDFPESFAYSAIDHQRTIVIRDRLIISAAEQYQRSAGEVEARNVETRQTFTPEQRASTPPSATSDTQDKDLIVTWNGVHLRSPAIAAYSPLQTNTPAFKRWFDESKVVDASGKPLVVYHGTGADITSFDNAMASPGMDKNRKGVAWFSTAPEVAGGFAGSQRGESFAGITLGHSNILPVYLSIKKPYVDLHGKYAKGGGLTAEEASELEAEGYDGIHWPQAAVDLPDTTDQGPVKGYYRNRFGEAWGESEQGYPDQWAAFRPTQIKSAVGNNGGFSASNPDIRFSLQDTITALALPASSKRGRQTLATGIYLQNGTALAQHLAATAIDKVNTYQGVELTPAKIKALIDDPQTPAALSDLLREHRASLCGGADIRDLLQQTVDAARMGIYSCEDAITRHNAGIKLLFPVVAYEGSLQAHKVKLGWVLHHMDRFERTNKPVVIASFLDWDRPLTEQSLHVKDALALTGIDGYCEVYNARDPSERYSFLSQLEASAFIKSEANDLKTLAIRTNFPNGYEEMPTGEHIYRSISRILGSDQDASDHLLALGIIGITSRNSATNLPAYVVFHDALTVRTPQMATLPTQAAAPIEDSMLSINDIPGVAIEGNLSKARAEMRMAVDSLKAKADAEISDLRGRLDWVMSIKAAKDTLRASTRSALTQATQSRERINAWVSPSNQNAMPWHQAVGRQMANKIGLVVGIDTSQMTGQQVFNLLAGRIGSSEQAAIALEQVGIIAAYTDSKTILWDDGSQNIAEKLNRSLRQARFHIAYHGSPHKVERFESSWIGKGEGANTYGRGFYFTERKSVAGHYQQTLSRNAFWYEEEVFTSAEHLANSIAPIIAAKYPQLRGDIEGLNQLETAIRQMIHVDCNFPERTKVRMENYSADVKSIISHVLAGIMPVTQSQRADMFVVPRCGARTWKRIEQEGLGELQHAHAVFSAELIRACSPLMSDQELAERIEACKQEANKRPAKFMALRDEYKQKLALRPSDPYLQSRLQDIGWMLQEAKQVARYIGIAQGLDVKRPLGSGYAYIVEIDIEQSQYLRIDTPFSSQKPAVKTAFMAIVECDTIEPAIRNKLAQAIIENASGEELHGVLAGRDRSTYSISALDQAETFASQTLLRHGVQGVKYPLSENGLRSSGFNYVVFDENRLNIIGHTEKPVANDHDEIPVYEWANLEGLDRHQNGPRMR